MANNPKRIIWHHSAINSDAHQATQINDGHRARNFPISALGFYGGYHLLIERDGTVFRFRNDNEQGAHAYGSNENSLGICLAGNFESQYPTEAQKTAFKIALRDAMKTWGIHPDQIFPHRSVTATACPGKNLYNTWAREILNDPEPETIQDKLVRILTDAINKINATR